MDISNRDYSPCTDDKGGRPEKTDKTDVFESELVFDDETENYEDKMAGIKISYKLSRDDVYEYIKSSAFFEKKEKEKKKQTAFQIIMIVVLVVLALLTKNSLYLFVSLVPLFTGVCLWAVPLLSMKNIIGSIYDGSRYDVEIFPDKIDVTHKGFVREFPLDESGKFEITNKLILVYSKKREPLIIPMRSIKPDCLPDVQAMIVAGARPI